MVRSLVFILLLSQCLTLYSQISFENLLTKKGLKNSNLGGFKNSNVLEGLSYPGYQNKYTKKVSDARQLRAAVEAANNGDVIYVQSGEYMFSDKKPLVIDKSIVVVSDRGQEGRKGARLYSTNLSTNPLIYIKAKNVILFGLHIEGPDGHHINTTELDKAFKKIKDKSRFNRKRFNTYGIPNSIGVLIEGDNFKMENCEVYNWSQSGVVVKNNANTVFSNNYIHHNRRYGLGYGISIHSGHAVIERNYFDYNRHDVASTGTSDCSYISRNNISLLNSNKIGHNYDVHGGYDRKDKTSIAGKYVTLDNNIIFLSSIHAPVLIRGNPEKVSVFEDNEIIEVSASEENNYLLKNIIGAPLKARKIQIRGDKHVSSKNNSTYKVGRR